MTVLEDQKEINHILYIKKKKYYLSPESLANLTYIHSVMNNENKVKNTIDIIFLKTMKQKYAVIAHLFDIDELRITSNPE